MKETIIVKLNKEEVGELVKNYVKKRYPTAKNFTVGFDSGIQSEGFRPCEHEVFYFSGVSVTVEQDV
jgi:hypothetical protein